MSDPRDPFEEELAARLRATVAGEAPPSDLVARAGHRSEALGRRRRRAVTGTGVGLVAAAALLALAIGPLSSDGDPDQEVRVAGPDRSTSSTAVDLTSSTASTTLTTSTTVVEAPDGGGQRSRTTPSTVPASPSAAPDAPPEPECREGLGEPNGYTTNPEFAGFIDGYWSTRPADDRPLSYRICIDDLTPRIGQTVTVSVEATDPDTSFDEHCNAGVRWGDEGPAAYDERCGPVLASGPDVPPAPPPGPGGSTTRTFTHAYSAPLDPKDPLSVNVGSGRRDLGRPDPYASFVFVNFWPKVHP